MINGIYHAKYSVRNSLDKPKRTQQCIWACYVDRNINFYFIHLAGRILNRFSKDMSLVDDILSFTFFDFCQVISI